MRTIVDAWAKARSLIAVVPQKIDQVNLGQLAPGDFFGEREQSGGVFFVEGRGDAARGTVVVQSMPVDC